MLKSNSNAYHEHIRYLCFVNNSTYTKMSHSLMKDPLVFIPWRTLYQGKEKETSFQMLLWPLDDTCKPGIIFPNSTPDLHVSLKL